MCTIYLFEVSTSGKQAVFKLDEDDGISQIRFFKILSVDGEREN